MAGQLRAFGAVAWHLNFHAAAKELAHTQSAVSRQIQTLESDVALPLFNHHTRAVELTSAGGVLLRGVSPLLERIDGAVRQIRQSVGLDIADLDLDLRHATARHVPPHAVRLSDDQITPVISPWLLKSGPRLERPDHLAQFSLIEAGDSHQAHLEWLTWRRWLRTYTSRRFRPSAGCDSTTLIR